MTLFRTVCFWFGMLCGWLYYLIHRIVTDTKRDGVSSDALLILFFAVCCYFVAFFVQPTLIDDKHTTATIPDAIVFHASAYR